MSHPSHLLEIMGQQALAVALELLASAEAWVGQVVLQFDMEHPARTVAQASRALVLQVEQEEVASYN